MKNIILLIILLPLVTSMGSINTNACSITEINIQIWQTITQYECYSMGDAFEHKYKIKLPYTDKYFEVVIYKLQEYRDKFPRPTK